MLIAWLLAVALGALLGYTLSQRGSRKYWQQQLQQQQAALRAELDAAKQQIQTLRQDNADLRYQLGESEKTRRYLEAKNSETPNHSGNDSTS
jgi:cell division protein FtsB